MLSSSEISEKIKQILKSQGLKQRDLARKLGKQDAEISKWLSGRHNFTIETVNLIERALGEPLLSVAMSYALPMDNGCFMVAENTPEYFSTKKYPCGIQVFEQIIKGGYWYVDKTEYVYRLVSNYSCVFLSRPRRFGKSLFVSTLHSYFEGRKDLFRHLRVASMEKNWEKYPVLRFDLSKIKAGSFTEMNSNLDQLLSAYEEVYGKDDVKRTFRGRLENLIVRAHNSTGKEVVLLIDEYDSPILGSMSDAELSEQTKSVIRSFLSPIKSSQEHLRFVFVTGITKFTQLNFFSEVNNLVDISLRDDYSGICGITESELKGCCTSDIQLLANACGITYEESLVALKTHYDGYHFSKRSDDVYNPYSLVRCFDAKELGQYWYSSGTPSFLIDQMRKYNLDILDIDGQEASELDFDVPPELADSALPLLYQSGYFTIKSYDADMHLYTLGIPNNEVRIGFLNAFLPVVTNVNQLSGNRMLARVASALKKDDIDTALTHIKAYISAIPYYYENKTEPAFQTIMYLILSLLGQYIKVEVPSSIGRTDAILETNDTIYVIEYKVDESPDVALQQIEDKHYADPYCSDGRRVVKVGISFSTSSRSIDGWKTKVW